jgi:hypothetical protein
MAKVQDYTGLHANLDNLYESVKKEIENQPNLHIVSEYKGTIRESKVQATLESIDHYH